MVTTNLQENIDRARKLFETMRDKNYDETLDIVKALKSLFTEDLRNEGVARIFAKSLLNLSTMQDLAGRVETTNEIQLLYTNYTEDEIIAELYSKTLHNLANKQNLVERLITVEKIRVIYEVYNNNSVVINSYSMALFKLTPHQDWRERFVTVEILKSVYNSHSSVEGVALCYAKGLLNLTIECESTEMFKIINEMKLLYENCKSSEDIGLQYAKSLFNMTIDQDVSEYLKILEVLKKLTVFHFGNKEIAFEYAKALYNLTFKQDVVDILETIKILKELNETHVDYGEIGLRYARALGILASQQDVEEGLKTIKILGNLQMDNLENKEILVVYERNILNIFYTGYDNNKYSTVLDYLKSIEPKVLLKFSPVTVEKIIEISLRDENYEDVLDVLKLFKTQLDDTLYYFFEKIIDSYEGNCQQFEHISKIYIITKKIMHELSEKELGNHSKLGHYTTLRTLPHLIKTKDKSKADKNDKEDIVKLRLNNANYMNDPSEGEVFLKFLEQSIKVPILNETLYDFAYKNDSDYATSSIYLFSLTSSIDKLPMWSQYGNDGEGCCLVLDNDFFDILEKQELHDIKVELQVAITDESLESENVLYKANEKKQIERFCPYHICYVNVNGGNIMIDNSKIKELLDLIGLSLQILDKATEADNASRLKLKKDIMECIEQIRYLFKSDDYKHEQETRLLKYVPLDSPRIKLNYQKEPVPWLYIERDDGVSLKFREVILGPKVKNPGYIAPYISRCDKSIRVRKSEIKYR